MKRSEVRKIVDTNFLQEPELHAYLAKSSRNYVVLFDFIAIEAVKKEPLITAPKSMRIVSLFPRQVIVLKPIARLCSLRGRTSGLQRRMIDDEQTHSFHKYCRMLASAKQGNKTSIQHLLQQSQDAQLLMERGLAGVSGMPLLLKKISEEFSLDELKSIRLGLPYSGALLRKMKIMIGALANELFITNSHVRVVPPRSELINTYIYRMAIAAFAFVMQWIAMGKQIQIKPEIIRNDLVDLHFIVLATFFDGLLSKDKKMLKIYENARGILRFLLTGLEHQAAQKN